MSFLLNPFISFPSASSYLVDDYSPLMAYSVRKISSTATNCLRVRRTSDSTEQDIGFSGDNLDTSSLATFCSGTSGYVAKWYDQSGNGHDAAQVVASRQPPIYSGGATVTSPGNGLPAMQLVSANLNFFTIASTFTTVQVYSHFMVFGRTATGVWTLTLGANATSPSFMEWDTADDIESQMAGQIVHSAADTSTGDFLLTTLRDSGNNISAWKNGSGLAGGSQSTTGQTVNHLFSNGSRPDGYVQEIILIHSDVEADRTTIEDNINAYYSLY